MTFLPTATHDGGGFYATAQHRGAHACPCAKLMVVTDRHHSSLIAAVPSGGAGPGISEKEQLPGFPAPCW